MREQFPDRGGEKDPQQEKRAKLLVQLWKRGLKSKDAVGYHGTSVEALRYLLEKGVLRGAPADAHDTLLIRKGDIHFVPLGEIIGKRLVTRDDNPLDAKREAAGYAEDIAAAHYFLKTLGLDWENEYYGKMARALTGGFEDEDSDRFREELARQGITQEHLEQILVDARKRKGVIVGFTQDTLRRYSWEDGDDLNDIKLSCPEGLVLDFLSGLEPTGEEEKRFFEELERMYGS